MVTFLFSVHTVTEGKQYAGRSQALSQGGGSSSPVIWPGASWCSAATGHGPQWPNGYKFTCSLVQ